MCVYLCTYIRILYTGVSRAVRAYRRATRHPARSSRSGIFYPLRNSPTCSRVLLPERQVGPAVVPTRAALALKADPRRENSNEYFGKDKMERVVRAQVRDFLLKRKRQRTWGLAVRSLIPFATESNFRFSIVSFLQTKERERGEEESPEFVSSEQARNGGELTVFPSRGDARGFIGHHEILLACI